MNFGPKRENFMAIIDGMGQQIGTMIPLIIGILIFGQKSDFYQLITIVAMIVIVPLYRLVGYFFKTFEIDEDKLIIRKGILKKQIRELPISTIISADVTQNVVYQFFKIYKINIDNASSASEVNNSPTLILNKTDSDLVRQLLLKKEGSDIKVEGQEPSGYSVNVSTNHIMFMGVLSTNIMIGFYLMPTIVILIRMWEKIALNNMIDEEDVYAKLYENLESSGLVAAVSLVVVYLIFAVGFNVISSLIKYHGFKIREKDDEILIEYGLLNKNSHTIKKDKITGIRFNQQPFMRMMHRGTLEVMAIGYQGTDNSGIGESLLFPILKESDVNKFLSQLLPNFAMELNYKKPEKKALPYFFINIGFILTSLILLIMGVLCGINFLNMEIWWKWIGAITGILWLFSSISTVLLYKNTGICVNENNISAQYGSIKRVRDVIPWDMVESISKKTTGKKEKKIWQIIR